MRGAATIAAVAVLLLAPRIAWAQELVADLSEHLIAITSHFTGESVLVFGTADGGDVVVTVRGPDRDLTVRRKERVAGIWINAASVTFPAVPGYYAVFANRPLASLLDPTARRLEEVGVDALELEPSDAVAEPDRTRFRQAFVGRMRELGLYTSGQGRIGLLGGKLFRATLRFPATVPVGDYVVTVLLVRDGQVIASQSVPLTISRAGLEAEIHDFAARESLLFGVFAVVAATVVGTAAWLVFRAA